MSKINRGNPLTRTSAIRVLNIKLPSVDSEESWRHEIQQMWSNTQTGEETWVAIPVVEEDRSGGEPPC